MPKPIDCVVCGSCVADVIVRPVDLSQPIGGGRLLRVEPLQVMTGGIVSNSGWTLAKLGLQVAAFTYVGDDEFGRMIRDRYAERGIDTSRLLTHPSIPTSTSAVLVDQSGERSFAHSVGPPREMNAALYTQHRELFQQSRAMLLGYFSLLPNLQNDLPQVLADIQQAGCATAVDAAGDGGTIEELAESLPYIDYYLPSLGEAQHQTGESDPRAILECFRSRGAKNTIGVKLGEQGAVISPRRGEVIEIAAIEPPGDVVDTTGAGDCFVAGYLAGVLRGLSPVEAGRLAAAACACSVTSIGAATGVLSYEETCRVAGVGV